jgi:hypothetical protein
MDLEHNIFLLQIVLLPEQEQMRMLLFIFFYKVSHTSYS